jgi:hypothetical protein
MIHMLNVDTTKSLSLSHTQTHDKFSSNGFHSKQGNNMQKAYDEREVTIMRSMNQS